MAACPARSRSTRPQAIEADLPPLRSAQVFASSARSRARSPSPRPSSAAAAPPLSSRPISCRRPASASARPSSSCRTSPRGSISTAAGQQPIFHPRPTPKLYTGPDEFFTGNFNFLDLKEEAKGAAEWLRWARLRASDGLDPMVHVLAVADALPPAAFKLLGKQPAPISSLTWIVNLLTASACHDRWLVALSRPARTMRRAWLFEPVDDAVERGRPADRPGHAKRRHLRLKPTTGR